MAASWPSCSGTQSGGFQSEAGSPMQGQHHLPCADERYPRGQIARSLKTVVGEFDVVAQVAADDEIRNERDPQKAGDKVAKSDAEVALRGE